MKHFEINGSAPPTAERKWRSNLTVHVVATSAMRAMELALQKHPELEVANLSLRGAVDIIQEADGQGICDFSTGGNSK